jgi:hypothetical protein
MVNFYCCFGLACLLAWLAFWLGLPFGLALTLRHNNWLPRFKTFYQNAFGPKRKAS